ncbi:hypothetical protein CSA56_04645 [candidate division KSB3 bacterium]|uniref:Uncharacterized protein n=1 Tax=candidate division KSB3 bacterium TaxID=2044937 RepID=A0A2G6KI14_9BACT|nr:MAG: hypothetical protein CSA56_04645 [candidate division KSB3 bacterium]
MSGMVKHFIASFVNLFCLGNFVIGTATYVLMPGQVSSPIPEGSMMLNIGIFTAIVTVINALRRVQTG